jgi:hypothetical protein|tara:strand:+ start:2669 stop:3016 length:348 start_codon:yes stop_codon:yes gene_type:complete
MKQIIQSPIIAILLLTLFSFSGPTESNFIGTYGVSENDPAKIELTLNIDKTFTYQDLSNWSKQINIRGNWEVKNNTIFLKNAESAFPFHHKWKIMQKGTVAKSRKGMSFYTLHKQ